MSKSLKQLEEEYFKAKEALRATKEFKATLKTYNALMLKDPTIRVGDRVRVKKKYRTKAWLGKDSITGTVTAFSLNDQFPVIVCHDKGCGCTGWNIEQLEKIKAERVK